MKEFDQTIGGEFNLSFSSFLNLFDFKNSMFSSGRSSFVYILSKINVEEIHVPYFICKSLVDACGNFNSINLKFYELNSDLEPEINYLKNNNNNTKKAYLLIDYFGFCNINTSSDLIRKYDRNAIIIGDYVMSYFKYPLANQDYYFNSHRKFFNTQEGSDISIKNIDYSHFRRNSFSFYKIMGAFIKHFFKVDKFYLKLFKIGENNLDYEKYPTKSNYINLHNSNLEYNEKQSRLRNYNYAYKYGKSKGMKFYFDFDENIVPLSIPVLVKDSITLRQKLKKYNIYLPTHWNIEEFNRNSSTALFFYTNVISLLIDGRYSCKEIKIQIDLIAKIQ